MVICQSALLGERSQTVLVQRPHVFHDVTFNVNMENETLSAEGLFLAGGADFGFLGITP